jgi:UDP-N-acetylmuramoylalanine--D-glutamate ligase
MSKYNNTRVAVVGLSVEGLDAVQFFTNEGAHVTGCDRRTKEQLGDAWSKIEDKLDAFQLGELYLSNLDQFDIVVRSPGIALDTPAFRSLDTKKTTLTSVTKLFFEHCLAPIIGVTGTKGKGTTSTLVAQMLAHSGRHVWLGGNVGVPLLSHVRAVTHEDLVVMELSSFQLEDLTQSPHVAVVLPITQDHLANVDPLASNAHATREDYVRAKESIVRYQKEGDFLICNKDNLTSMNFASLTKASVRWVSRTDTTADAFVQGKSAMIRRGELPETICSLDEIHLLGAHNLENIATASLVALHYGVSLELIQQTVRGFEPLHHRLEFVRTVSGVSYYNDSFSTVPETTIAAIDSFDRPLILIVGGSEKGADFTQLGKHIAASHIKTLIVIGDMQQRIVRAVSDAGFAGEIVKGLDSMSTIVQTCHQKAVAGDVVLLSPACASFDMFTNYKERGSQFIHEVSLL